MKRIERLGEAVAPDGTVLTLYRHDRDYVIQANGQDSIRPVQGAPLERCAFTEYDTGEREVYDLTVDP